MSKLSYAAAVLMVAAACLPGGGSSGNVNGVLRTNQVTAYEVRLWQDARCGMGANFGNCCHNYNAVCLDFPEFVVGDVRVDGNRAVILTYLQDGMGLLVSDDRGKSWREVPIGSIGNIFGFFQASLFLSKGHVYLMVLRFVPRAGGDVYLGEAWEVDPDTHATTRYTGPSFISGMPAAVGPNGEWMGAFFGPDDLRGGSNCTAILETWSPPAQDATRRVVTIPGTCPQVAVPAANSNTAFSVLYENSGLNACIWTLSAAGATLGASGQCVPWAEWAATGSEPFVSSAFANERAELIRPFTRDGQALVASPLLPKTVALGPGKPARNRGVSGRQRYPGMVAVQKDDGTAQLVRVNRDGTVDAVNLPGSPCNAGQYSCFDPKNSDIGRGDYGDLLWAEPLGNDEYLAVYIHDFAPGINQVKQTLTTSIEKATYTPLENAAPVEDGPAGYPKSTKGGKLAAYCARKAACTAGVTNDWMYSCAGNLMRSAAVGLESAVTAGAAAPCTDPIFTQQGYFDCLLTGGTPAVDNNLQLTCTGGGPPPPVTCTGALGDVMCEGDKALVCNGATASTVRCDLMNMSCSPTSRTPAWSPCVSKKAPEDFSTVNQPMRCEGRFLIWHINGTQYLDCKAEGYASCSVNRCVF
jgi:hypothetical protein